jgi:acetyl esterase
VNILNGQQKLKIKIRHHVLWHPLVDSVNTTNTFSEFLFQDGPILATALIEEGLSNYYGDNVKERSTITASPIMMTPAQLKEFMPPSTIITAENDWLRDEGQNFARLLQIAGVECGVIQEVACVHDSVIFNASRSSPTVQLALLAVTGKLKEVLRAVGDAKEHSVPSEMSDAADEKSHKRRRR